MQTLTGDATKIDPGFKNPPTSPLQLLQQWLTMAEQIAVSEPYGFVLSTVDNNNHPSSRVVLLKTCDETGITFGTSENSAKGKDFLTNRWVAGNIWWRETLQQINFQGTISKLSIAAAEKMFANRDRHAQATAILSSQSEPMLDATELFKKVSTLANSTEELKRPENWFAYHIKIKTIEFWLGNPNRFHQRLQYKLETNTWQHQFLQP